MPMCGDRISLDRLVYLAEEVLGLRSSSGTGCAALGVNYDGIGVYVSRLEKRIDAKKTACRIAARIGNEPGILYLLPVYLRQAVDRLFYKPGAGMVNLIPLLINIRIGYSEIGTQVDDLAGGKNLFRQL